MQNYRTKDNEMLDTLCYRFYSTIQQTVEKVLEANPHLADLGSILPANTMIYFPDLTPAPTIYETIKLWD